MSRPSAKPKKINKSVLLRRSIRVRMLSLIPMEFSISYVFVLTPRIVSCYLFSDSKIEPPLLSISAAIPEERPNESLLSCICLIFFLSRACYFTLPIFSNSFIIFWLFLITLVSEFGSATTFLSIYSIFFCQ